MNDVKNDVLHRIRTQMATFSKGQRQIADYILENYDKAAFLTASRLGQMTRLSESTVVRFAAELGYDSYHEMQRALQELIRGRLTSVQRIQASHERINGADTVGEVMQRDMDTIHAAIENVDRAEFNRAVDMLLQARRIYILGVRSSSFLAGYLNFYLHLICKNVTLVQSFAAGEIYEQMVHIEPGDVLIGISFPRYSITAVNAVHFARDRGADVIAITDSTLSPLYAASSAALMVRSDMISFVDSMAAPLSLLNALIAEVGRRKPEDVAGIFADMEQVWNKYGVFGRLEDE